MKQLTEISYTQKRMGTYMKMVQEKHSTDYSKLKLLTFI